MLMRYRCCLLLLCLLAILVVNGVEAYAMDTGFSTEELTEEEKETFVTNVCISSLVSTPTKKAILCFDINEQGMIAVGQKGNNGKEICIYDANGVFLYGYAFNCSQSFAVELNDNCVNIYFIRSDVIMSLDSNGNIMDIKKVQDTTSNNKHRTDLLYSTKRTAGETTYLIKNDMGIFNWIASSYSQIITIDSAGAEQVIYDVNSTQFATIVTKTVCILLLTATAGVVIIRQLTKSRNRN